VEKDIHPSVENRADDKRKGAAREITTNQQDQRIDIEAGRDWLSTFLYSLGGTFFQEGSLD
jgi:hypothetical protein